MPSPREIAESVNNPAGFREDASPAVNPEPKYVDQNAHPVNPPANDGAQPFKNLKEG